MIPEHLVAQNDSAKPAQTQKHSIYQLIDMGTLSGSEVTLSFVARILNNRGMFGGQNETSVLIVGGQFFR